MRFVFAFAFCVLLAGAPGLSSCPFCVKLGRTISDQVAEADWVGFGTISKDGRSLVLETLVKSPPKAPDKGTIRFSRSIGAAGERKLVFAQFDSAESTLKPTRSQTATAATGSYLAGLESESLKSKRTAFLFRHLDSPEAAIRDDAYKALSKMGAADLAEQAAAFDVKKLRRWIQDPEQPPTRIGLFGLLLGMAGQPEDASFLAALASSRDLRAATARDGFLGGLALLDRERAESIALKQLADNKETLSDRQAALNAIQFILDELPRRDPQPLLEGLTVSLKNADLRDAVVDVLRLHSAAFAAEKVFASSDATKPSRATVKFALASPSAAAEKFLIQVRKADPQLVKDCESALKTESRMFPAPPFRISERRRQAR